MIRLDIINDGTGTMEAGNYDVYLYLPEDGRYVEHNVRVESFDRSLGWAALIGQSVALLSPEKKESGT